MAEAAAVVRDSAALDELGVALRGDIPDLLGEVCNLLRSRWPDYADYLDANVISVAEIAASFVRRLLDTARRGLANMEPAPLETAAGLEVAFQHIGRAQCQDGRDLTELLSAYRVGAHAAWRHVSATALRLDLPPNVLAALGEAVFVFVDQLASASAHGYVDQQAQHSVDRERLRHELADLLLSNRSATSAVRSAAERAGWELPSQLALVIIDKPDDLPRRLIERLDHRCLPVRQHDLFGVVVPGPLTGVRKDRLAAALAGANAVVGQSVPLRAFPASVRLPRLALELRRRGALDGDPVFVADHLDTLIVRGDQYTFNELRAQVLQPLAELSPATRARLIQTLRSWLHHMGDRSAVADELFIHPQTVSYRMSQLRDCFG
ncbi:MAG TPA: helix-turn-helix domain-containing protein, partial [Mycobacterium sp.]|nr:helix-turn-helix domain-containing protein [Mycobacterium sp.]